MSQALYNSANQLYRSFNTGISFAEFIARMKRTYGEDFFQKYQNGEISYEAVRRLVLQKPMFALSSGGNNENILVGAPEQQLTGSTSERSNGQAKMNIVKTLAIVGALAYIGYRIYKSRKG